MLVSCVIRASATATAAADDDNAAQADFATVNGTRCSFYSPAPVTLAHIERLFPFDGKYHFRQRVSGASVGLKGVESVWLDLREPHKELRLQQDDSAVPERAIEIQALALHLPEVSEEESRADVSQYLEEVAQEMPGLSANDRPRRHAVEPASALHKQNAQKKGLTAHVDKIKQGAASVMKHISKAASKTSQNVTMESVSSGVSSLWNSITKQTLDIFNKGSVLSDAAEGNLAELSDLISTSLQTTSAEHADLLRDLWDSLFSRGGSGANADAIFAMRSDKWKEAGFQSADPGGDLKSTGLLALRAMIHMGLAYPDKAQEMIQANKVNTKTKYPYAIVCVNITLLLSELLNLRDNKYMSSTQVGYWAMFEDPEAFFEMFCICLVHMNATWIARQAVRADFGKLIGEIKGLASRTLSRNPTSVMDFRMIAIDEGMSM